MYGNLDDSNHNYMKSSRHGNTFRVTAHLCRESSGHKAPAMLSLDIPFVVYLNSGWINSIVSGDKKRTGDNGRSL